MGEITELFRWPVRAAIVIACHLVLALLLITGFWGVEKFIHFLWGNEEPLLFDAWPLKWLFQLIDVVLLLVFLVSGAIQAARELKRQDPSS